MGREWTTRSFKSGNSIAVRIPAGVGIEANKDWVLVEGDGELILRAADKPKKKFDVDAIWGIAKGSGMRPLEPHEREFEDRPSARADERGTSGL